MWTNFKFWFGRVEVVAQGAPGLGIISSIVLLSDDLDEIDWEMKGTGGNAIGTNYWGKGILDYTNNVYAGVSAPNSAFHTYTLDWSPSSIVWEIDGVVVRTVTAAQAGNEYPQSPMKLSLSLWDGGDPSNAEGTITWAGGKTLLPPPKAYSMYVRSAKITNTNPAAEYEYADKSGNASSIKIINESQVVHPSSKLTSKTIHSSSIMPSIASSLSIKAEGTETSATSKFGTGKVTSSFSSMMKSLAPTQSLTVLTKHTDSGSQSQFTSSSSSTHSVSALQGTSISTEKMRSVTPSGFTADGKSSVKSPSTSSSISMATQESFTTKMLVFILELLLLKLS